MPTPLIGANEYPAIRAVIDVSLEATVLPDAVLALPTYVPSAILDVLRLDPAAESRTGAELARVQNAAVLFAAARVGPAIPAIRSETFDDYRYDRGPVDWQTRAAELRAMAAAEVDAVITTTDLNVPPQMFTLAQGRRGV
jgi:hypothetical protein